MVQHRRGQSPTAATKARRQDAGSRKVDSGNWEAVADEVTHCTQVLAFLAFANVVDEETCIPER
jgi:hypothetical protein